MKILAYLIRRSVPAPDVVEVDVDDRDAVAIALGLLVATRARR